MTKASHGAINSFYFCPGIRTLYLNMVTKWLFTKYSQAILNFSITCLQKLP